MLKYKQIMNTNFRSTNIDKIESATIVSENKLLRAAFSWMALAMVLTAISSLLFSQIPQLFNLLYVQTEFGTKPTIFGYFVIFAPLIFILAINFGVNKMSYPVLIVVFISYSIVMGLSLSFIFIQYKLGSILNVFFSSAALYAIMAIAGYTTKTDLTKMGSILRIGLISIVIASVINVFIGSSGFSIILSVLGVAIFTGLTAYHVQAIKNMGMNADNSNESKKYGLMGALTLYLNFINLFMSLLRLFGDRR